MCAVIDETPPDTEPTRRRFTVDEFQRMGEAGIFAPDERVELIDGEVIEMTPVGPRHISTVIRLTRYFVGVAGDDLLVSVQSPVRVKGTEPMPDFALLHPRGSEYDDRKPQAEDCVLIVEVADSSARFDREEKSRLYAEGGIAEYWVLDLPRTAVVVHAKPAAGRYRTVVEHPRGATFASPALGGREIRTDDLLV